MDNIWDTEDIQFCLKNRSLSRKSKNLCKSIFSHRLADSQQNYL